MHGMVITQYSHVWLLLSGDVDDCGWDPGVCVLTGRGGVCVTSPEDTEVKLLGGHPGRESLEPGRSR